MGAKEVETGNVDLTFKVFFFCEGIREMGWSLKGHVGPRESWGFFKFYF